MDTIDTCDGLQDLGGTDADAAAPRASFSDSNSCTFSRSCATGVGVGGRGDEEEERHERLWQSVTTRSGFGHNTITMETGHITRQLEN